MDQLIDDFIATLVDVHDVDLHDSCPICLSSFSDCVDGVTKLEQCGHLFCKTDIIQWIRTRHGTCPACRQPFLDIQPYSETDDESSDGGEYIPNEDEEDEEDALLDADDFTSDFDVEMSDEWDDVDIDEAFEQTSESSEGDLSLENVEVIDITTMNNSSSDLSDGVEEPK